MILRRVIDHFRKQEWTAIAIDFVIVVLGVFVGLQVSNWNTARAEKEQEAVLIARLADDLRAMRNSFHSEDEQAKIAHAGWIAIFRALENCRPVEADPEAVRFAISRYQRTYAPDVQRTAYDEMTSQGMFSRLADRGLKDDIALLYARLEGDNLAGLGARADQLAAGRIMWKFIPFTFASDDIGSSGPDSWGRAEIDPLKLCDNLELRGAVWEMVDLNRDWIVSSARFVADIDRILDRLPIAGDSGAIAP
jgi:hypothetical protein